MVIYVILELFDTMTSPKDKEKSIFP